MNLHVVYSSDDNYAQHVGVSMLSLLENNKEFSTIDVYIIENNISKKSKNHLISISNNYDRNLHFISLKDYSNRLKLNIGNSISINSYARLFLTSILGEEIDKVLYMDCDSIITSSLAELWQKDISEYYVAGVSDTVGNSTKEKINMDSKSPYINAGMLLVNLKKWRENHIERAFIDFIDSYNGKVYHHDQGTINGVLEGKMLLIHPKYNAMTTFFTMKKEEIFKYYGMQEYYSSKELIEAKNKPVFVHFTPAFVNRPWIKGNKHPLAYQYQHYLEKTPWKGTKMDEDKRSIGEKIVATLFNNLPFTMAFSIRRLIFK
ncbi:glycosyltransferase family 8 protein [Bacillus pinisoli]|uniref:glycosyltransferase family 8 protein n=1 Tax=Bacillus pinisoli TaxID=2901866 RepID=UPI001FF1DB29|nr:glycosyltransferase family 8 protein [Bacillus pinisoli]